MRDGVLAACADISWLPCRFGSTRRYSPCLPFQEEAAPILLASPFKGRSSHSSRLPFQGEVSAKQTEGLPGNGIFGRPASLFGEASRSAHRAEQLASKHDSAGRLFRWGAARKVSFLWGNRIATSGHFVFLLAMTLYGFVFLIRHCEEDDAIVRRGNLVLCPVGRRGTARFTDSMNAVPTNVVAVWRNTGLSQNTIDGTIFAVGTPYMASAGGIYAAPTITVRITRCSPLEKAACNPKPFERASVRAMCVAAKFGFWCRPPKICVPGEPYRR